MISLTLVAVGIHGIAPPSKRRGELFCSQKSPTPVRRLTPPKGPQHNECRTTSSTPTFSLKFHYRSKSTQNGNPNPLQKRGHLKRIEEGRDLHNNHRALKAFSVTKNQQHDSTCLSVGFPVGFYRTVNTPNI
jgi:hypothetical protein